MTARVGLIIPSSNRMVEQEMVRHFPPEVEAHVMRLRMTGAHHVDGATERYRSNCQCDDPWPVGRPHQGMPSPARSCGHSASE